MPPDLTHHVLTDLFRAIGDPHRPAGGMPRNNEEKTYTGSRNANVISGDTASSDRYIAIIAISSGHVVALPRRGLLKLSLHREL